MNIAASKSLWFVLALMVTGCGAPAATKPPAGAPAAKDAAASDDVLRPITQAQLSVGHYATGDGNVGFVLDRTKEPARIKMDGEKDVLELTKVEERDVRGRKGFFYKAPDGRNVLFIAVSGSVELFAGRDRFTMNSDKAAAPLGAATVSGQWAPTKSKKELETERLAAQSVVAKLGMKGEDAENLTRVEAAIASAPKELFVRITKEGAAQAKWTPEGRTSYSESTEGDETWTPAKVGYAKFGGRLVPNLMSFGQPNRLHTRVLKGWSSSPAPGTPGLVWEVDGSMVTFVTVDGGRYTLWLPDEARAFEDGAGPVASWPAPMQHGVLSVSDVHEWAKRGAVPKKDSEDLNALDDGWFTCIGDVWKKANKQIEAIERSQAPMQEKYGKASGIGSAAEQDAAKTCAPAKKALEEGLVKAIEARAAERKAIHAKANAKLR